MIKKFSISFVFFFVSLHVFSQAKYYDETALLFSQDKLNGTARYLAMSGAFGALGGDLSSVETNPAGMAIFNENTTAITLNTNYKTNYSSFYNANGNYNSTILDFAQFGIVGIFDTSGDTWNKFSFSINTTISNDFDNIISLKGNNGISNEDYFLEPVAGEELFDNVTSQSFYSTTYGDNAKTYFTIAAKYNKRWHFGFSVITSALDFEENVKIREESKDSNEETFRAVLNQRLKTYGEGLGFSFGAILKPSKHVRLGLSLQTPTWYSLTEEFKENTTVRISTSTITQPANKDFLTSYRLATPSKLTSSIAYIFGKKGLLSLDYSYKDYSDSILGPKSDFDAGNELITQNYTSATSLNIGGEYRLKYVSLRAGYQYESNPYKNSSKQLEGYSFGLGFKTGASSKLDFAINRNNYFEKNYYLNATNPITSENELTRITATYSVSF